MHSETGSDIEERIEKSEHSLISVESSSLSKRLLLVKHGQLTTRPAPAKEKSQC